ncbi:MAG: hypothetical protein IKS32_05465 [Solobacterium sp.]|nr:hypothetical protein [Solobacterium sp.]
MTSNKYRKFNESIRLSEEAKEAVLNQVLKTADAPESSETVRQRPAFRMPFWTGIIGGLAAVILLVVLPLSRTPSATEYAADAPETGVSEEMMQMNAMAASEAHSLLPDLSAYSDAQVVEQRIMDDGSGFTEIRNGDQIITIRSFQNDSEMEEVAAEETDYDRREGNHSRASDAEVIVLDHNQIHYEISFSAGIPEEQKEKLLKILTDGG